MKVNTDVMQHQYDAMEQILQRLNETAQNVNAVNQRLSWDVAVSKRVRQVLGQQNQNLTLLSNRAELLRQALLEAIRQYEQTERANAGKDRGNMTGGGGKGAFGSGGGGGGFRGEEKSKWKELIEQIGIWLDGIGGLTEEDTLGLGGSIVSLILSIIKLSDLKDGTFEEIMQLLTDVTKDGAGALDKIYKLLEEKLGKELKLSDKACIAGLVSSYLGVASAMEEMQGLSWVDKMRNSKKLIESMGSMVSALYGAIAKDPAGSVAVQFVETAVSSVAVAAITMIGDVAYYMGDGKVTSDEWGKVFTNGPTQGLTSWIKGASWNIVDINPQELLANYERNIDRVSAFVARYTNGNTAKRIAMILPAGTAVFIGGTYEMLRSYYEKLSNLFPDNGMVDMQYFEKNGIPGFMFPKTLL